MGYPEKANLAFDANDLRLALIWQGAFIDASKHWVGRGAKGFRGRSAITSSACRMAPRSPPCPTSRPNGPATVPRTQARPIPGGIGSPAPVVRSSITKSVPGRTSRTSPRPSPAARSPCTIRRTIDLTDREARRMASIRIPRGRRQEDRAAGRWLVPRIDGEWKVRLVGPRFQPIVRESAGKAELILPVKLDGGQGADCRGICLVIIVSLQAKPQPFTARVGIEHSGVPRPVLANWWGRLRDPPYIWLLASWRFKISIPTERNIFQ